MAGVGRVPSGRCPGSGGAGRGCSSLAAAGSSARCRTPSGCRRRRGGRRRAGQRRMVLEDRQLQPHQLRPGVEAQLVGEVGPRAGDGAQRVGLSPAPVEGLGQQRREPFTQGLLGHRGLEARHGFAVAPVVEQALEAILDGGEAQLLQPHALGLGVGLVGHVEQRRSVPQAERLVEEGEGLGRWRLLGSPHELLEAVDVERSRAPAPAGSRPRRAPARPAPCRRRRGAAARRRSAGCWWRSAVARRPTGRR